MTVSWIKDIFKPTPLPCVSCSCSWWSAWRRKAHWTKILTVTTKPYCFHLYSLIEAYLVKISWSSAWRPWQFLGRSSYLLAFQPQWALKVYMTTLYLTHASPTLTLDAQRSLLMMFNLENPYFDSFGSTCRILISISQALAYNAIGTQAASRQILHWIKVAWTSTLRLHVVTKRTILRPQVWIQSSRCSM